MCQIAICYAIRYFNPPKSHYLNVKDCLKHNYHNNQLRVKVMSNLKKSNKKHDMRMFLGLWGNFEVIFNVQMSCGAKASTQLSWRISQCSPPYVPHPNSWRRHGLFPGTKFYFSNQEGRSNHIQAHNGFSYHISSHWTIAMMMQSWNVSTVGNVIIYH